MTAPMVELKSLGHSFGKVTALDGISLRVAKGELFGLVGPDGSGKTTTLRILAGVLRPSKVSWALVNSTLVET